MKIAAFHDYFDEIGGAELTLLNLARGLNATIFTTNINRRQIDRLGFKNVKLVSIGRVPNVRHIKQLMTQLRFFFLKIRGFDLHIFGGSYSIHASRNHKPNIWFCFSPLRGLYDLRCSKMGLCSSIKQVIKQFQIYLDQKAVNKINKIIAPSRNIEKRIWKYYRRRSKVIYSPVNIKEFKYAKHENYWLSVLRVDPYKRIELQSQAFSKLPGERLIVVGGASYEYKAYFNNLKKRAPRNVIFIGPKFDRKMLADMYSHCKGFITTSNNEDFGKTVIEAMASGKPVIAPKEGGYKETVISGKTGKLIDDINAGKIVDAIRDIGINPEMYKEACLKQANRFDVKIFTKKIKEQIG